MHSDLYPAMYDNGSDYKNGSTATWCEGPGGRAHVIFCVIKTSTSAKSWLLKQKDKHTHMCAAEHLASCVWASPLFVRWWLVLLVRFCYIEKREPRFPLNVFTSTSSNIWLVILHHSVQWNKLYEILYSEKDKLRCCDDSRTTIRTAENSFLLSFTEAFAVAAGRTIMTIPVCVSPSAVVDVAENGAGKSFSSISSHCWWVEREETKKTQNGNPRKEKDTNHHHRILGR